MKLPQNLSGPWSILSSFTRIQLLGTTPKLLFSLLVLRPSLSHTPTSWPLTPGYYQMLPDGATPGSVHTRKGTDAAKVLNLTAVLCLKHYCRCLLCQDMASCLLVQTGHEGARPSLESSVGSLGGQTASAIFYSHYWGVFLQSFVLSWNK